MNNNIKGENMEKEICLSKLVNKLIALVTSVILLAIFMAIDIIKIHVINTNFIILSTIISLIAAIGAIGFKFYSLTKKQKYIYYQLVDFFLMLNIAFIFVQLIFVFVFFPAKVIGTSMYPTFKDGDNLIIQTSKTPNNFDIVVLKIDYNFNNRDNNVKDGEVIIKRVIGVEGDTFYFDDEGILHLNNQIVNEVYLKDQNGNFKSDGTDKNTNTNPFRLEDYLIISGENVCTPDSECKVPKDYYFVLGDNRYNTANYYNSLDSRLLGLFHKSQVLGVAKYKQVTLLKWDKVS